MDAQNNHRHSIRLPDYDYSQPGAYYITLITWQRQCLFGEIREQQMFLSGAGQVVWDFWNFLPARYPQITIGTAVVMPNHFHGIIQINEVSTGEVGKNKGNARATGIVESPELVRAIHELPLQVPGTSGDPDSPKRQWQSERRRMTLPLVVGYFKMNSAKRINQILASQGVPVWHRNYYEHIIRNDEDYNRIHLYIEANIENWATDDENPVYTNP